MSYLSKGGDPTVAPTFVRGGNCLIAAIERRIAYREEKLSYFGGEEHERVLWRLKNLKYAISSISEERREITTEKESPEQKASPILQRKPVYMCAEVYWITRFWYEGDILLAKEFEIIVEDSTEGTINKREFMLNN